MPKIDSPLFALPPEEAQDRPMRVEVTRQCIGTLDDALRVTATVRRVEGEAWTHDVAEFVRFENLAGDLESPELFLRLRYSLGADEATEGARQGAEPHLAAGEHVELDLGSPEFALGRLEWLAESLQAIVDLVRAHDLTGADSCVGLMAIGLPAGREVA